MRLRWPKGKLLPRMSPGHGILSKPAEAFSMQIVAGSKSRRGSGTLFHQSRIPSQKCVLGDLPGWGPRSGKGVDALSAETPSASRNYKTVWLMGHKIRQAMLQREGRYRLKGTVQVDEIKLGRFRPWKIDPEKTRRSPYPVPDGGPGRGHEGLPSVRDV